jgi:SAM-dependent methyltransferase
MFFADPVAAYKNIGQALKTGGRLAMMAWRDVPSNEWIVAMRDALSVGRDLPMPPPNAPGPFGFADQDHVRRVPTDAGFGDVQLDVIVAYQELGTDAEDAFSFVRTMGVVKGLTADLDEAARDQALKAVRETLAAHETPDGVLFGASAWLITAVRP